MVLLTQAVEGSAYVKTTYVLSWVLEKWKELIKGGIVIQNSIQNRRKGGRNWGRVKRGKGKEE